ncbi:MAG: hypothetical protein ACLQPN_17290 [Bryobacteraceae bacterium]
MRIKRGSKQIQYDESRYHFPDGKHDEFVWVSRVEFLEAIQRLAPQVLVALRDNVLSELQNLDQLARGLLDIPGAKYMELLGDMALGDELIHPWLAPQGILAGAPSGVPGWPVFQAAAQTLRTELMPTVEKLMSWARHFFLTRVETQSGLRVPPEWVLNAAWGTLTAWDRFPALKDAMSWHPPSLFLPARIVGVGLRRHFKFFFDEYDPRSENWEEFERRFRSSLSKSVRSFLQKYKGESGAVPWKRMPNKWQKQHFEWLVLFQINGHSPGQIADGNKSPITEIAVLKGVHNAARIIDLTPRPGRRGKGAGKI